MAWLKVGNLRVLAARLAKAHITIEWDDNFAGYSHFYASDPIGNRLEFMEPVAI